MSGSTAVTLTANRTAAAAPSRRGVEAERDEQDVAADHCSAQAPSCVATASAPEPRRPEHAQAGAHARERVARLRQPAVHARRARRQAGAQQRGRDEHGAQHGERRQRVPHQRLLAAGEQPDGGEHHRAEDHQREHVQQRLGDERAEHGGQPLARAAEAARDDQRARRLAEPRGQRRRHQHADRRALHRVAPAAARASGSAARRIACQATARADHRGAHQRQPDQHPHGLRVARARGRSAAGRCAGARAARRRRRRRRRGRPAARRGDRSPRRPRGGGGSSERQAARGRARARRRPGSAPIRTAARCAARLGRGHRARVLVGGGDLLGDPRPGVALGAARRRRRRAARVRAGSSARSRSVSASAVASPRGTSRPSTPSRDDVAVAGDVGGDDRRAGGERLGQHHAERLAAERRRAQHVGVAPARRAAASSSTRPSAVTPARVDEQRRDLVGVGADDRQLGGHLARAAPRTRAAAPAGPCARRPGRRTRSAAARRARARRGAGDAARRQLDAVGDDPVVAAVEAPAGPRRRLGDRDPHGQAVELAAGAQQRRRSGAAAPPRE